MSSVLNRDVKQFGKKFMFDGEEETCWNSDQVGFILTSLSHQSELWSYKTCDNLSIF